MLKRQLWSHALAASDPICSNLDRLEIFVGDAHLASSVKPATAEYPHLPYPPRFVDFSGVDPTDHPELRVDGYLDDDLVLSRTFSSDSAAVTA